MKGYRIFIFVLFPITFAGENKVPEEVYLNGSEEPAGNFLPFGKPLGLYNECSVDDREVLSRRGAKVSMSFLLNYRIHEEKLELPEMELEYKAIMKKPREQLNVRPAEVLADYVCWEYLSETGWKRLLKDERTGTMFNGSVEGPMTMEFICPEDMASTNRAEERKNPSSSSAGRKYLQDAGNL